MLSRIAALLPLCSHVRVLVSAARPKESSFLQRRTKFSERRSERPDVTSHCGKPRKAKTMKELKQKETITMETKLTKTIMSSPGLHLCVWLPGRCDGPGHVQYCAGDGA